MKMKRIAVIVITTVMASVGSGVAQSPDELAKAAHTYKSQCVNCHQPPDLSFSTDRAWLDQVHRTG